MESDREVAALIAMIAERLAAFDMGHTPPASYAHGRVTIASIGDRVRRRMLDERHLTTDPLLLAVAISCGSFKKLEPPGLRGDDVDAAA